MLFVLAVIALSAAERVAVELPPLDSLAGWTVWPEGANVASVERDGARALCITVDETQPLNWYQALVEMPCAPGEGFRAEVEMLGEDLCGGGGGGLGLNFYDANRKRLAHVDQYTNRGVVDWHTLHARGEAPPGTATVGLCLVLHGRGRACFRQARLEKTGAVPSSNLPTGVTLTVTDQLACDSLVGFGFEDDGWFYNEGNAEHGADAHAYALREQRIEWMQPDWVRMFFWYHDWNPTLDGQTFTWDSGNMLSHYRTLDLYQRLGVRVTVCGVEWGFPKPFENAPAIADAVGALLEHVIVDKGYTCVREWTLTNEPNLFFAPAGNTFEKYVELHGLVRSEFARRKLDVAILGSDDGDGLAWFEQCVREDTYFDLADAFASHFYLSLPRVPYAADYFADRLDLLVARTPRKPFVVAEFGLQDQRTVAPDQNPLMREYDYALNAAACFIDGLNMGVAGFSTWCVHEMYYPGGKTPMRFGLWDFGGEWPVRPIYHAVALFTRHTNAGDRARRCRSSAPGSVKGVMVGENLFWVNLSMEPIRINICGAIPKTMRAYTEDSLAEDRECGLETILEDDAFTVPARSFGLVMP